MSSRALDSTGRLLAVIVERSQPKHPPPRTEIEDKIRDLDQKSAQCYADLELKSHRLRKIAHAIETTDAGDDVTPVAIEHDEDSLVIHIDEVVEVMRADNDD